MNPSSQLPPSMIGGVRRLVPPMTDGDVDSDLLGDGDSPIGEESRLLDADCEAEGLSRDFGLSFPVGPLPSVGRFAGGKFSAARRQLFSSSSSDTRSSRA